MKLTWDMSRSTTIMPSRGIEQWMRVGTPLTVIRVRRRNGGRVVVPGATLCGRRRAAWWVVVLVVLVFVPVPAPLAPVLFLSDRVLRVVRWDIQWHTTPYEMRILIVAGRRNSRIILFHHREPSTTLPWRNRSTTPSTLSGFTTPIATMTTYREQRSETVLLAPLVAAVVLIFHPASLSFSSASWTSSKGRLAWRRAMEWRWWR